MLYIAGLGRPGRLWVEAVEFDIVDKTVTLTSAPTERNTFNSSADLNHLWPARENLDFEESVPLEP
jgi:hypothetical protein